MRVGTKPADNSLDRPRCVLCNAQLNPNGPGRNQTVFRNPDATPSARAIRVCVCLECRSEVARDPEALKRLLAKMDELLA